MTRNYRIPEYFNQDYTGQRADNKLPSILRCRVSGKLRVDAANRVTKAYLPG